MKAAKIWKTQKDEFSKVAREWTENYASPDRDRKLRLAMF